MNWSEKIELIHLLYRVFISVIAFHDLFCTKTQPIKTDILQTKYLIQAIPFIGW